MNSIEKINKILDVSKLPEKLPIEDGWEAVFITSELDPVLNSGHVPEVISKLLLNYFENTVVFLNDAEPTSSNEFKFKLNYSDKKTFHLDLIDEFFEEQGFWGFVAEFEKDGTFVIGLDQEFIIIISPKQNGFISSCGGTSLFKAICLERFNPKKSEMNQSIFNALVRSIYT
jgi:hypothetical protein